MLNPKTWDDKNDTYFLELYKKQKEYGSVLALCLSRTIVQSYNQWRIFSPGNSGVCISFNEKKLLSHFSENGIFHKKVAYKSVGNLKNFLTGNNQYVDDLPFLKRNSYSAEKEYRVIQGLNDKDVLFADIPIDISCINRITLSPWMPIPLANSVKSTIKNFDGASVIKIYRSTILDNKDWKWTAEFAPVLELI